MFCKYQNPANFGVVEEGVYSLCKDLSEIQQYLPEGHPDLIKKDTFVLTEYWYIRLTRENQEALEKWRFPDRKCNLNDYIGGIVGISPMYPNDRSHNSNPDDSWGEGSVEITFEQFQKYVLKEEAMNTFGLKVGDHLDDEVISEWVKQGNNRWKDDEPWHSSTVPFIRSRTIEEFKTCDGFTGMLLSNTYGVYLKCEGFLEFKESFNKEKTMEKEIIGWKLVKPEYEEAAIKITGFYKGGIPFKKWML